MRKEITSSHLIFLYCFHAVTINKLPTHSSPPPPPHSRPHFIHSPSCLAMTLSHRGRLQCTLTWLYYGHYHSAPILIHNRKTTSRSLSEQRKCPLNYWPDLVLLLLRSDLDLGTYGPWLRGSTASGADVLTIFAESWSGRHHSWWRPCGQ